MCMKTLELCYFRKWNRSHIYIIWSLVSTRFTEKRKRIPPCISLVIHRSLNPDGLLLIRFWLEGYCFFLCFISLHWKTKQNKKTLQRFLVLLPAPKASSLALFLPFIKKRRLLEESLGHSFCSWSRGGRWIFISPCDPLTYLPNLAPDPHLKICKCPLLRASQ